MFSFCSGLFAANWGRSSTILTLSKSDRNWVRATGMMLKRAQALVAEQEAVLKRLKKLEKPYEIRKALGDTPRITVNDRDEIYAALSDKSHTKLASVARPFIPPNASPADEFIEWISIGGIRRERQHPAYPPGPGKTMKVSGWSNSTSNKHTGAGYGVRIQYDDRDLYFSPEWNSVEVIPDNGEAAEVSLPETFWTTCPELRSSAIGRLMLDPGVIPRAKGKPPQFDPEPVCDRRFRLTPS